MIFIGLDLSKISTALCIENQGVTYLFNYTTKKIDNIWVKKTTEFINYKTIIYKYSTEKEYSNREILKLNEFDYITDLIITDILNNVNKNDEIKIGIEGYSYNSKGPIFDLIEFSTILKHKLLHTYTDVNIISPLTLKSETCKMVYQPRIELKGKKVIKEILHYENTKGKQATNFDKWDMFYAYIDSNIDMKLKKWCIENLNEITKGKEVFKPLDDIIDACWIVQIMKKQYYQKKKV
jgi:hypothetical protein